MNPGDKITVHMCDAKIPGGHALEARETDHTTGKSGFMIASAKNGFMTTNPFDCTGTPFNFQPAVLHGAGAEHHPVGHRSVHDQHPVRDRALGGLHHGHRPRHHHHRHVQRHLLQELPGPVRDQRRTRGDQFEPDDSPCYPKGDTHGGTAAPNLVTGCDVFFDAIGDLDYDGQPYWADWPQLAQGRPVPDAVPAAAADDDAGTATRRSSS